MNNETKIIVEKIGTKRSGVYAIVNPNEQKAYIGETEDFGNRWAEHIRSICGLENSSNENMMYEEGARTFWIFTVSDHNNNIDFMDKNTLVAEETIYMYLFRKAGFYLYNGNRYQRDNMGWKRKWLYQEDLSDDKLMECLLEMRTEISSALSMESLEEKKEQLNRKFKDMFDVSMDELLSFDEKNRRYVWECSVENINDEKYLIKINDEMRKRDISQIYTVCHELRMKELTKETLKNCGLKEKSVLDMAKQGDLDCFVVSKFGAYYYQSPVTILETKTYDIMHNSLEKKETLDIKIIPKEEGEYDTDGICTWALERLNPDTVRSILDKGGEKRSRYAILPYTMSKNNAKSNLIDLDPSVSQKLNRWNDETMEDFFERMKSYYGTDMAKKIFADGYTGRKKHFEGHNYPETAFPEIISKYTGLGNPRSCRALLISGFYYPKEYFDIKDFYKYFLNYTGTELNLTLQSQCSHALPNIKENMRYNLVEWLAKTGESKEMVSCIIARLEYPYVIDLTVQP
ncbi:MAG: GIY-YIG nuclease family protein [Lachnospiraceae bacterium]|nr:GIY-YIG nuclease family protein [Lachnospiraceae bacterium]